jgi:hypothetical protein
MTLDPSDRTVLEGAKLIDEIESFLVRTGMSAGEFGKHTMNSTSFVPGLREGRVARIATVHACRAFMDAFLREGAGRIREWKGVIEVNERGEPNELPPGMPRRVFRMLVKAGAVIPSRDSLFKDIPSQTYRPVL